MTPRRLWVVEMICRYYMKDWVPIYEYWGAGKPHAIATCGSTRRSAASHLPDLRAHFPQREFRVVKYLPAGGGR